MAKANTNAHTSLHVLCLCSSLYRVRITLLKCCHPAAGWMTARASYTRRASVSPCTIIVCWMRTHIRTKHATRRLLDSPKALVVVAAVLMLQCNVCTTSHYNTIEHLFSPIPQIRAESTHLKGATPLYICGKSVHGTADKLLWMSIK